MAMRPEPRTWKDLVVWRSPAYSIYDLTVRGHRALLPTERGYYAFTVGEARPDGFNCLYIGIAVGRGGLKGRLLSYLKTPVTYDETNTHSHAGKAMLWRARIQGTSLRGSGTVSSERNDRRIFLHVAIAPFDFDAPPEPGFATARRTAYDLERALIDYYKPQFNKYDQNRDMAFELDDDLY